MKKLQRGGGFSETERFVYNK